MFFGDTCGTAILRATNSGGSIRLILMSSIFIAQRQSWQLS
jgi:hypothetical protein